VVPCDTHHGLDLAGFWSIVPRTKRFPNYRQPPVVISPPAKLVLKPSSVRPYKISHDRLRFTDQAPIDVPLAAQTLRGEFEAQASASGTGDCNDGDAVPTLRRKRIINFIAKFDACEKTLMPLTSKMFPVGRPMLAMRPGSPILLAHGLIRSSFVPEQEIQELRELLRTRKQLGRQQNSHIKRLQKTLRERQR
jgi:hypothetical protein